MFNQGTYGTCIKFVIDGQQIMGLAYQKMKEATSSIWIANYDLDPDICLLRKHGYINGLTTDGSGDSPKNDYTLQSLLIEKAREKVDIKIILWEPRLIVRKLPVSKKRGIEGREKKAKFKPTC